MSGYEGLPSALPVFHLGLLRGKKALLSSKFSETIPIAPRGESPPSPLPRLGTRKPDSSSSPAAIQFAALRSATTECRKVHGSSNRKNVESVETGIVMPQRLPTRKAELVTSTQAKDKLVAVRPVALA